MKVGDFIYNSQLKKEKPWGYECQRGVLMEFIPATHHKETQKIKVLTKGKLENWVLQYCKIVK